MYLIPLGQWNTSLAVGTPPHDLVTAQRHPLPDTFLSSGIVLSSHGHLMHVCVLTPTLSRGHPVHVCVLTPVLTWATTCPFPRPTPRPTWTPMRFCVLTLFVYTLHQQTCGPH